MASPNFYNPGATSGARLATRSPVAMSGKIWYVCNASGANGADAASPRGQQRAAPLLTLSQAITNASAGDTIQILAGHVESYNALAVSKAGLHIYGEGTALTRPQIYPSTAAAVGLSVTAAGVWIENLTGKQPTTAGVDAHIGSSSAATNLKIVNCSFTTGSTQISCVTLGASTGFHLSDVTITAGPTTIATRSAIAISSASTSDVFLERVTIDGGTVGWSDYAYKQTAGVTRLVAIDFDLLNDSDVQVATGSIYRVHRRNASGSSWLELTA